MGTKNGEGIVTNEAPVGPSPSKRPSRRFLSGMGVGVVLGLALGVVLSFSWGLNALLKLQSRNNHHLERMRAERHQMVEAPPRPQGASLRLQPPELKYALSQRPAFDFSATLETVEGRRSPLATRRGKVLFVNFWATWCGPCMQEMPAIKALVETLGGDDRFAFVLISLDKRDDLERFLVANPQVPPVALLPSGVQIQGMGQGVPVTMIVDRQGRVAFLERGAADWGHPSVVAYMRKLAAEPDGTGL